MDAFKEAVKAWKKAVAEFSKALEALGEAMGNHEDAGNNDD